MKCLTDKIDKFVTWTIDNQWPIPTMGLWKMYQMQFPEVEDLTTQERSWLSTYCENLILKGWLTGSVKGDATKAALTNYFGWSEKQKVEQTTDLVTTKIVMDGLLTENTSAGKHDNESLENEAIKFKS